MSVANRNENHKHDQYLSVNINLTVDNFAASADDLAHRVLPYLCSCGYHLVGFTQAWATHTTTYAHCVNNACSNYYNTQELSYYMDTAS